MPIGYNKNIKTFTHLRREQIDRSSLPLKQLLPPAPAKGWIAEIRAALGMTSTQLARRLGVKQPVVSGFEKNEREGKITLDSLSRAADALGCEVRYAFVPKTSLNQLVDKRTKAKLDKIMKDVEHTMALEGQKVSLKKMLDLTEAKLGSSIWDE